ncbi:MAG: hypothetical protein FWC64_04880 [Treponema sp.]|nr:hypothetical protein [Treponema sp.]
MKMRFKAAAVAAFAIVCVAFAGCIIENREPYIPEGSPWGIPAFSGTRSATANSHYENGVTVTIDLVNGIITDVRFTHLDTIQYFFFARSAAEPIIRSRNTFAIPLDAATGSTRSLRGIIRAGTQALLQIPGVEEDDIDWEWEWEWEPPTDEEMG